MHVRSHTDARASLHTHTHTSKNNVKSVYNIKKHRIQGFHRESMSKACQKYKRDMSIESHLCSYISYVMCAHLCYVCIHKNQEASVSNEMCACQIMDLHIFNLITCKNPQRSSERAMKFLSYIFGYLNYCSKGEAMVHHPIRTWIASQNPCLSNKIRRCAMSADEQKLLAITCLVIIMV